ncbi:MAG: hypothetical protein V1899_06570 [Planctomycetota bacterium]
MKRFIQRCEWWRAGVFGLLFATLSFSFALATTPGGVASRAIDVNFQRPPTEFLTDSDLGLAVAGSQLTRQVLVRFGFKPHVFSLTGNQQTALAISNSGAVSGVICQSCIEIFTLKVIDDIGADIIPVRTKAFFLTAVAAEVLPARALQFAHVSPPAAPTSVFALPNALTQEPYGFSIHPNGGIPPYCIRLAAAADLTNLPVGLTMDSAGLIYGKPIIPSPLDPTDPQGLRRIPSVFTIRLSDKDQTVVDQKFSLIVEQGVTSSNFVGTSGKFTLNFGSQGKDSATLSILLNKADLANNGVRTKKDLTSKTFQMQFGGAVLPPRADLPNIFDTNGTFCFPNLVKGILHAPGELLTYRINFNPATGKLKIKFANMDLIQKLNAQFNTFQNPIIPISIKIGDNIYNKTDIIKFLYERRGSKGKGTAGMNDKKPPGGIFLVTKVRGSEQVKNQYPNQFDNVVLCFNGLLRQPADAVSGSTFLIPQATDTVAVLLGNKCLGQFPASDLTRSGNTLSLVNADFVAAPLKTFKVDNDKGAFFIDTFPLNPIDFFAQDVLQSDTPFSMSLTITIFTPGVTPKFTFDGQSSMTLFRKGNHILNK